MTAACGVPHVVTPMLDCQIWQQSAACHSCQRTCCAVVCSTWCMAAAGSQAVLPSATQVHFPCWYPCCAAVCETESCLLQTPMVCCSPQNHIMYAAGAHAVLRGAHRQWDIGAQGGHCCGPPGWHHLNRHGEFAAACDPLKLVRLDAGRQGPNPVLHWQRRGLSLTQGHVCEAGQHQRNVQDDPGQIKVPFDHGRHVYAA